MIALSGVHCVGCSSFQVSAKILHESSLQFLTCLLAYYKGDHILIYEGVLSQLYIVEVLHAYIDLPILICFLNLFCVRKPLIKTDLDRILGVLL